MEQVDLIKNWQRRLYGLRNFFLNGPSDDTFPKITKDPAWSQIELYHFNQALALKKEIEHFQGGNSPARHYVDWAEILAATEQSYQDVWNQLRPQFEKKLIKKNIELLPIQIKEKKAADHFSTLSKSLSDDQNLKFFAHGSYGDGNAIFGISDIDLAAFVTSEILLSEKSLRKVAQQTRKSTWPSLLNLDPEQHHGIFFFSDYDLKSWNESMLPLECLSKSNPVKGMMKADLSHWPSSQTHLLNVRLSQGQQCLTHFKRFFSEYQNHQIETLFDLKYINQNLLLMPAIIYSSIQGPIYKPTAIDFFKKASYELGINSLLKVLECAEETRLSYSSLNTNPKSSQSKNFLTPFRSTEENYRRLRCNQRSVRIEKPDLDIKSILASLESLEKNLPNFLNLSQFHADSML